jgi:hypothetical protein
MAELDKIRTALVSATEEVGGKVLSTLIRAPPDQLMI